MAWTDAARRAALEARRRARGMSADQAMYAYGSIGRTIHTPVARKGLASELRRLRKIRRGWKDPDSRSHLAGTVSEAVASTKIRNYARKGGKVLAPAASWGRGDSKRYGRRY